MKLVTNLLAVTCLTMSGVSWAQKTDWYAYQQNDNFHPRIYEATADAKVYFDIDKEAIEKGVIIKKPFLVIKAVPQTKPDKGVRSRSPVVVTGKIQFGHNVAGGNFQINGGRKRQYILVYVGFIDEATQAELGKLADSGTTVTVKGTLEVWKDGSAAFDNAYPISIFK
jgi:hypothetical protein